MTKEKLVAAMEWAAKSVKDAALREGRPVTGDEVFEALMKASGLEDLTEEERTKPEQFPHMAPKDGVWEVWIGVTVHSYWKWERPVLQGKAMAPTFREACLKVFEQAPSALRLFDLGELTWRGQKLYSRETNAYEGESLFREDG